MKNDPDKQPIARLMILAFRGFEQDLLSQLEEHGICDITLSDFNVLRHLDREGLQLTTLARHAGLSKQAVGKIAKELERKGYLRVEMDIEDGRAKSVTYTKKGQKLIEKCIFIVHAIEQHYETLLGKDKYQDLKASLTMLLNMGPEKS
jgi:DNA-binding MarR family transcriptional regulator